MKTERVRKTYAKPKLARFGDMRELTAGTGTKSNDSPLAGHSKA